MLRYKFILILLVFLIMEKIKSGYLKQSETFNIEYQKMLENLKISDLNNSLVFQLNNISQQMDNIIQKIKDVNLNTKKELTEEDKQNIIYQKQADQIMKSYLPYALLHSFALNNTE